MLFRSHTLSAPYIVIIAAHAANANRWLAETMNLYHGDCLEVLPTFPPASVEAIITDLPYGTTACEWDSIIPLAPMWEQVKRVLKPSGVFISTASQPFTTILINSNLAMFKYEIIWDKVKSSQPHLSKIQPMKRHENTLVFGVGAVTYNPQLEKKKTPRKAYGSKMTQANDHNLGLKPMKPYLIEYDFPTSILEFSNADNTSRVHPTQKPVSLYEYLIRTYTNAGETVLDICMGSGTTGVAAIQTGRNFIGIEKEQKYFEIASRRIAQAPHPLFTEPPRQPTKREPDLKLE